MVSHSSTFMIALPAGCALTALAHYDIVTPPGGIEFLAKMFLATAGGYLSDSPLIWTMVLSKGVPNRGRDLVLCMGKEGGGAQGPSKGGGQ